MKSVFPSVLVVKKLAQKSMDLLPVKGPYPWEQADQDILTMVVHTITDDVDDVSFKEDGSIWARPARLKLKPPITPSMLLNCLDDRTSENKPVLENGYYRMGRRPFDLLKKVAESSGCQMHTTERLETAQKLGLSSADQLSFPLYYAVRDQLAIVCPHDDRFKNSPEPNNEVVLLGLTLPELTSYDHPKRLAYAITARERVIGSLLKNDTKTTIDDVPEQVRDALLKQTNVFWWLGFSAEFLLAQKLRMQFLT